MEALPLDHSDTVYRAMHQRVESYLLVAGRTALYSIGKHPMSRFNNTQKMIICNLALDGFEAPEIAKFLDLNFTKVANVVDKYLGPTEISPSVTPLPTHPIS